MISEPDFRVIHVFPYTAQMAGGHSNAAIAFMEAQMQWGLDVCGICPLEQGVLPELRRSIEHLPIREVDFNTPGFCQRAMEFTAGCEQPIFHFHGYTPQFASLSADLTKMGIHYVATSQGQLHYREKFHWLKKFVFINFAEAFFHNASGLHFLTEWERSKSSNLLPFWRRPVLVHPNLVETPDPKGVLPASREQHGIPSDTFVFAYLGRLHVEHKGLDLMLRAFAEVVAVEKNVCLMMIGGDWDGGRQELEDLARNLGCADRVRFMGAQYGQNKWRMLKMADAFVSPSRWEAFGIAQVEALCFGLPAVISDCMNLAPELAAHNAAIICPMSVAALSEAMKGLMRNPQSRVALSASGRKWAIENCSYSKAGARFENFYRLVLGDSDAVTTFISKTSNGTHSETAGSSLNVVHVFPYSPKISGGHSNAIRSFIECQRVNGINAVGIGPAAANAATDSNFEFPFVEVDSLSSLRWGTISGQFKIEASNSLVHFHNVSRTLSSLINDLRQNGIPYVFTGHGQFSYRSELHWLQKFFYLHCLHRGPLHAGGLHVLAKFTERQTEFLLPTYRGRKLVLGNLIKPPNLAEVPVAARSDYGVPQDAFVLLFLGRLDMWIKGLDLIVEAFSYLTADRFWLVMAGPDWKGGKAKLEQKAREFGCRDRVIFPGPVYGEKKWALFKMADVFISPSRFEAFNITQAEAMTCGLPVITSTATSLVQELRDAGAAILCPLSAEPLARAIAALESDQELRRIMSMRSKAWADLHCDPKRAGARFQKFYESVMERHSAKN